jgi:hypothetical protein
MPKTPNPKTTKRDVLSLPAMKKAIAKQRAWCVVDRRTAEVIAAYPSRSTARRVASAHKETPTTIVLAELRVAGQRA